MTRYSDEDGKDGTAFFSAATDLLLGRYDRLGMARATRTSAINAPFILHIIPRVLSAAEDFTCRSGSGLGYVRARALAAREKRWWHDQPEGSYADFLLELQDRIGAANSRYLALLSEHCAPPNPEQDQERNLFAASFLHITQNLADRQPAIELPDAARPYGLLVRKAFDMICPLVISDVVFLPNRTNRSYSPVPVRSLSRGFLNMPAVVIDKGDAFISSVSRQLHMNRMPSGFRNDSNAGAFYKKL